MDYKEKIELAKDVVNQLKKGLTYEEIKIQLSSKGIFKYEIEKIFDSVKNLLDEEYGMEIETHLKNGTLEQTIKKYEILDPELFGLIIDRIKLQIIEKTALEIKTMKNIGFSNEEIINKSVSFVVSEEEVRRQIENFDLYISTPKEEEKLKYWTIAILLIVTGSFVLYLSAVFNFNNFPGVSLLCFGLYNIYKAYTPKGGLDSH